MDGNGSDLSDKDSTSVKRFPPVKKTTKVKKKENVVYEPQYIADYI